MAFAGDVNLGASMHRWTTGPGHEDLLRSLDPIAEADLAVVNLEAVVASTGTAIDKPGVARPRHFRGRPETVSVLTAAGVDAVLTANNHSGDYGTDALLEQALILDAVGIAHAGSGPTMDEACDATYLAEGGISVALFSVDTTQPIFAATDERPGTCHLALDDAEGWEALLGPRIAAARTQADNVLVGIHWGENFAEDVAADKQRLGRVLIELGADAVLGSNAHQLQGIEVHDGRPIIHDAAHLLFNFAQAVDSAVFELTLSASGVERLEVTPIVAETGTTRLATGADRERILDTMAHLSSELGTSMPDGQIDFDPERRAPIGTPAAGRDVASPAPAAGTEAPAQCIADVVPESHRVTPTRLGPLELVGFHVREERLTGPGPLRVTTYWRLATQSAASVHLSPTAELPRGPTWATFHEPCDWAWPADRWEPDVIYRDVYVLRPAAELVTLRGVPAITTGIGWGTLDLGVVVRRGEEEWEASGLGEVSLAPSREAIGIIVSGVATGLVISIGIAILLVRWRRRRSR